MVYFVFRGDSQVCVEVDGLERLDFVSSEESFTGDQILLNYFFYLRKLLLLLSYGVS